MEDRTMRSQNSEEAEENLQITVPSATKKDLRMKAAETGDTMRVIVLRALSAAGIKVPNKELLDRRKAK
jgi:hypothetical protein